MVKYLYASSAISYWPLNESGSTLTDLVSGNTLVRLGSNVYAGPSFRLVPSILYPVPTTLVSTPALDACFSSGDAGLPKTITVPRISISLDYGEVPWRGYLWQSTAALADSYPLVLDSQVRPTGALYGAYHGLGIAATVGTVATYSTYYNSFRTAIGTAGISLWFFKLSTTYAVLISGWSVDTPATYFEFDIGTALTLVTSLGSETLSTTINANQWHHLLILWKTDTTTFKAVAVLDGDTTKKQAFTAVMFGAAPTIVSSPRLVLGGKLNPSGVFVSSAGSSPAQFDGYIRRAELLDFSQYDIDLTHVYGYLAEYATRLFLATTGCSSKRTGTSCSLCDAFSAECFPNTVSLDTLPDGSASCSSTCASLYYTGCNLTGTCTSCPETLCLSCAGNGTCIECKTGATIGSNGLCACDERSTYSSTTKMCETCSEDCYSCVSPADAEKCTSCYSGLSLVVTSTISSKKVGYCSETCPDGQEEDNGVCVAECAATCKTCSVGEREDKCTSCWSGYYLVGQTEGYCMTTCPDATAFSVSEKKCLPCDSTCATCVLPGNSTACLTCNSSTPYKTETWSYAVGNCSVACYSDSYIDPVEKQCYPGGDCPITLYKDTTNKTCLACDSSCFGCSVPADAGNCMGCASSFYYLRLKNKKANSGTCMTQCKSGDKVNSQMMVCYAQVVSDSDLEQTQTLTDAINSATTAFSCTSIFSSLLASGNVGALTALLGPLQMLNLFSVINIPQMPVKLGSFFTGMGITSFEFLPNAVTYFIPASVVRSSDEENQLTDNSAYDAGTRFSCEVV